MGERRIVGAPEARAMLVELGFSSDDVAAFQREWQREETGRLDQTTIILIVDAHEAHRTARRAGMAGAARLVRGRVTSSAGDAAPGLTVRIVELEFRTERTLGEHTTDKDGKYALVVPRHAVKVPLVVRVLDHGATVAQSASFVANGPIAEIDLTVPGDHVRTPTEIERIATALHTYAKQVEPAKLEVSDLEFLVAVTGTPESQLVDAVVAYRIAALVKVEPAVLYALLRNGTLLGFSTGGARVDITLDSPPRELLYAAVLLPADAVRAAVAAAITERIVPSSVARTLDRDLETLGKLATEARQYNQTAAPKQLVDTVTANLAAGTHTRVLEALQAMGAGDPTRLASTLGAIPLSTDSSGSTEAVARVIAEHPDILELFRAVSVGPAAETAAPARAAATARFAADLDDTPRLAAAHAELKSVLAANPNFDLASGNVETVLRNDPRAAGDSADAAAFKHRIRSAQRVYRIAPKVHQSAALLDAGVHSAAQVAAMGKAQFVAKFTRAGAFTVPEATAAFHRANDIHIASGMLASELRGISSSATLAATASPIVAEKLKKVAQDNPNFKTLFSLVDLCACEECRSIIGPAAYLVDVLQFFKNRIVVDTTVTPHVASKTAKEVLFARRPDLGDIDLTCDNAMVPLPYIDIVCELLEQAVAPDPGFAYSGAIAAGVAPASLVTALQSAGFAFTSAAYVQPADGAGNFYVRDAKAVCKLTPAGAPNTWTVRRLRQTFAPADELAAAPEYVNDAAYQVLQTSKIAFELPYDLAHEESRAYFQQFGVGRDELMRALVAAGVPAARDIAAEALDISDVERGLIGTSDPTHQDVYWNTPSPATVVNVVDTFLTRTGLSYGDLQQLLALAFINPDYAIFIRHLDSSCDTKQQVLENLDDDALDRIHRFLRLQRRLGWSLRTLDHAIAAARLGNKDITDDPLLVRLADLERVASRLQLEVDELINYYGTIPTDAPLDGTPSPYAKIFLNPSANGSVDTALTVDAVKTNEGPPIPATQKLLSDVAGTLSVTLGAKPADIDLLIAARGASNVLTFENLALLYAQVSLARALGRSISDFLILGDLTGIDPFATPASTLQFADASDALKDANIRVVDLRFWLTFVADDIAVRSPTDAAITAILTTLQKALQAAYAASRSPFDATLNAEENAQALLDTVAKLPGVTADQTADLLAILDRTYTKPTPATTVLDELFGAYVDTTAIDAAQVALAALPASATALIEAAKITLIQAILDALAAYFFAQARADLVPSTISSATHLDQDATTAVLAHAHLTTSSGVLTLAEILGSDALIDRINTPPAPPAIDPVTFADQYAAVRLLRQIVQFAEALALGNDDLAWLLDHAKALGWLQLDELPYAPAMPAATWAQLSSLLVAHGLFERYPAVENPVDASAPFTLQGVFETAIAPGATAAQILDLLAAVTGWDRTVLGDLDARFTLSASDVTAYQLPETLQRLETAVVVLRKLGVDVAQGVALSAPQLTASDAVALRSALRPRYAPADWLAILKQIYDPLRQQKRDALVAYILSQNLDMVSSDDLFDYFLVDVEMCSCGPTSRIVSAHGSLQLFAQRCLLGIEPTSVADTSEDDGWSQWDWMSAYRVWEANRQVFLYPENWLDPAWRDDKSEPFLAMENALAQSDLSEDAVSDAAIGYLEALDDLSFLEVMSMYYEERTLTMHVFARTKGGDPHTYYYRTFVQERSWTPWKKVDLDIKSDHLIAFIRNGRLNLAWPIFTEVANPDQDTAVPDSTPGTKVPKTQKAWQIQLAVSEYANGVWLPSKTSKDSLQWTPWPGYYEQLPLRDYFRFIPLDLRGAGFSISCSFVDNGKRTSADSPGTALYYLGGFSLAGCKGYPEPFSSGGNLVYMPRFRNTDVEDDRFVETSGHLLSIWTILGQGFVDILTKTPNAFKVTYPQQISLIDYVILIYELLMRAGKARISELPIVVPLGTFMPYFFEDSVHNYVVIPGYFSSKRDGTQGGQPIRRTFSDVLSLLEKIIALIKEYLLKLEQDPAHDLKALLQQLVADPTFLEIVAELRVYTRLRYGIEFDNFYHPLVCSLRRTMYSDGIPKLMERATQLRTTPFDFYVNYGPQPIVHQPFPIEDIDFSESGSYSSYNWELFFHMPYEIAVQLTADQQFSESMKWFHYIFNPTDASSEPVPQKYWQTKKFFQTTASDYAGERIDTIMNGIASDPSGLSIDELRFAVSQWRENPFEPFLVARSRTVAFQQATVMKYIDNLIAWGDSLFTQDTMESVNQATQMYVLADKLLGPRPRTVPPLVTPPPETYSQLESKIDLFGNALLDLENLIPDLSLLPHGGAELPPSPLTLSSLYFCVPPNPNLDAYWDRVADRLFKIRHCQDINGVERTLALFAPPIDPGALIAARAAGLSISALLAGLNAPLPFYRFSAMQARAVELAHNVTALGASLLQALEKKDAEALARLRSTEEITLLNAMLEVKQRHIDEAEVQIDVLNKSIDLTKAKADYYKSRKYMNDEETTALSLQTDAKSSDEVAKGLDIAAAIIHLIPTFNIGIAGFGGSPAFTASWGSENLAGSASGFAQVARDVSGLNQLGAAMASSLGGYDRRKDEWDFQAKLADLEVIQLQRQVDAANIRLDIAKKELAAHKIQIANAKETDAFLKSKFTNTELYTYMVGQLSAVFYKSYQLALDVAHQAERCFQFELGTPPTTYINYNYWDSQKKGLLSGDRLMSDIKQMDVAYMRQNRREYELTKHVSLAQLDGLALAQLRSTGACTFSIPEASFDLDHPGHYFRRLKTVSITIPCVTGPYTSISAKLSLVGSRYRKSTLGAYPESPGNDPRFVYNPTAIQSVATSQGEHDSGLFELNFHDERYLPFEYSGAISSWRLELPKGFPQFDYNAISDVVLRLRYTARDGGSGLRSTVETQLRAAMNAMIVDASTTGLYQGFDLRRQFPDQWYQLTQNGSTSLTITTDLLPFYTQGHAPAIDAVTWIARVAGEPASTTMSIDGTSFPLSKIDAYGKRCKGDSSVVTLGAPFVLGATDFASIQELSFIIHYTLGH